MGDASAQRDAFTAQFSLLKASTITAPSSSPLHSSSLLRGITNLFFIIVVIVRDGIQLGEGKSVVLGLMAKCGLIKAFCPSTSLDSGNCQNELITEAFAIKYWSFNGISMASDWLKILFNYNFALINSDRCLWFAAAAEQEEEFCSEQGYLMKFFNSHYISHQQPPFQVKLILQVAHNYYNLHLKVRWFRVHKKFKICAH